MNSPTAVRLYYFHDPMCSWCWGFQPTWQRLLDSLPAHIKVQYVLGGLAGDTEKPMPIEMQQRIRAYWMKIQQVIPGTQFNFEFWQKCKPRRSTYPACRAVIAARLQLEAAAIEMISAIQKAYYLKAENPSDDEVLIDLATQLGLDKARFVKDLNSPQTQSILIDEVSLYREFGNTGLPSLVLLTHQAHHPIAIDYTTADNMLIQITALG